MDREHYANAGIDGRELGPKSEVGRLVLALSQLTFVVDRQGSGHSQKFLLRFTRIRDEAMKVF